MRRKNEIINFDTSSKALSAILEDETLLAGTALTIKKNHSIAAVLIIDFALNRLDTQGLGSHRGSRRS